MTVFGTPGFLRRTLVMWLAIGLWAPIADASGYGATSAGEAFVDEMVTRYGFDRDRVGALLAEARRKDEILESISRPAERTLSWGEYRQIFIKPARIEQGLAFL